jgi:hypothetical protein
MKVILTKVVRTKFILRRKKIKQIIFNKYILFFGWNRDPGSEIRIVDHGWEKILIWDEHPRSAILHYLCTWRQHLICIT